MKSWPAVATLSTQIVHVVSAVVAITAVVWSFLKPSSTNLLDPRTASIVAIALGLVGICILSNSALGRTRQVIGDPDVEALLEQVRWADFRYPEASQKLPFFGSLMGLQVLPVLFALAIAYNPTNQPPTKDESKPTNDGTTAQQGTPAPMSGQNQASDRKGSDSLQLSAASVWGMWPLVAALALSEAMYLAWLSEGEAAADELILISRRWARRRLPTSAVGGPTAYVSLAPALDPPSNSAPAAVPDVAPPIARARYLCNVLSSYDVQVLRTHTMRIR